MATGATKNKGTFNSITYVFTAALVFSIHDVMIKWISGTYPVHEIVFIRSVVGLVPIVLIVRFNGGLGQLKTRKIQDLIIRSLLMFSSYVSFYLSLSALPIAVSVSLFFSSPIFIFVLSVLFLNESVDKGSWAAVFAGFLGVVIMLNPGADVIDPAAFLAVLSALFYAVGAIMTRKLGKTESGLTQLFYLLVVYLVCSLMLAAVLSQASAGADVHPSAAFFLRPWQIPPLRDIGLLLSIGLMAALGIYCLTQAYRLEDPSRVAPFEYIAVPLGAFWGLLLWHDVLDLQSIIGIFFIIGSGLFIIRRKKN